MASYRDLLQQVKSEIDEVDVPHARDLLAGAEPPLLVDIRELDEWTEGRIPGAIHLSRGFLESRIEQAAPDRTQPIILYCAGGNRSAFAAKTLGRARLRERLVARRRLHRLEAQRASPPSCPARSTRRSASATAGTSSFRRSARRAS